MSELCALEIIARASREGTYCDPRDPRGTRSGVTYADICLALGFVRDKWGADMALMIGTRDVRNAEAAKAELMGYVGEECLRDGIQPDVLKVGIAVERAISDAVYSPKNEPGGSRYYRWAMSHLMARAESAAGEAIRKLYAREEAAA